MIKYGKVVECHNNSNPKKDNNLESVGICDTNKLAGLLNKQTHKINENRLESDYYCQEKIYLKQSHVSKDSLAIKLSKSMKVSNVSSKSSESKDSPVYLIRSVLAQNILRSRNDLPKNILPLSTPMVSVLKKPPNISQSLLKNNSDENTVTTTNSLNNEVQNIIVQNTQDLASGEQAKKPPFRKKLNLEEYRNRRDQNRSDNSRTNSPIQHTTLSYAYHAFTITEPIKNDSGNLIWSEKEFTPIFKPKSDIDEGKNKSKPLMYDIGIQTYETVFEFTKKSLVDTIEKNDKR